MPGRMIHPSFAKSETLAGCSFRQRLLFAELVALADDQGRLRGHAGLVRSAAFPFDDLTNAEVDADLDALATAGCILRYQVDGRDYLQIPGWWTYQHPQWAGSSQYPAPDGWSDRLRYHQGPHHAVFTQNWRPESQPATPPPVDEKDSVPSGVPSGVPFAEEEVKEEVKEEVGPGVAAPATNPGAPVPPATFQKWQDLIKESKNRPATLRWMFAILYPGLDPPDYGYLGKTARGVGGAGRLAELLWQFSTRPPTGDVLAYIQAGAKRAKERAGPDEPAGWAGLREWLGMQDDATEQEAPA